MPYPIAAARGMAAPPVADWWTIAGKTCVAAYQFKGAATLAASYVNRANPGTYDCTVAALATNPPALVASGLDFDGATTALETGISMPSGQAAWSVVASFTGVSLAVSQIVLGTDYTGEPWAGFALGLIPNSGSLLGYFNNGGSQTLNGTDAEGTIGMRGKYCFIDGTPLGQIAAGNIAATANVYIGSFYASGALASVLDGVIESVVFYSDTLADAEMIALMARMAAL